MAARQHLVAVRTWDGVTFLEVEMNNACINLNLIDSQQFIHSPLHVEWHQVLFGQALIRLEGGMCYIWDLNIPSENRYLECLNYKT